MIYGPRQVGLLGLGSFGPRWNVRGFKAGCASREYQMTLKTSSRISKHHIPYYRLLQNLWSYMISWPRQMGLLGLGFFGPRWNVRELEACSATRKYQMTLETSSRVVKYLIPCCHPFQNQWFYMIYGPHQVGLPRSGFLRPRWNVRGFKVSCATQKYQMILETSIRVTKHYIPYCHPV